MMMFFAVIGIVACAMVGWLTVLFLIGTARITEIHNGPPRSIEDMDNLRDYVRGPIHWHRRSSWLMRLLDWWHR